MRLVQIAQHAEDLARATRFYVSALGAEEVATFDPPGIAFVRLGDVRIMFERDVDSARLYLEVEDVRESVVRMREDGVEVVSDPHPIFADDQGLFGPAGTTEWQAFVRDSEGNLVGLVSRHDTQSG